MRIDKTTDSITEELITHFLDRGVIAIDKMASPKVLKTLTKLDIYQNTDLKFHISCENENATSQDYIANLDLLEYLPEIQKLSITAFSSSPLTNIQQVDYLNNLKDFSIQGFLKNLKFEVLEKFNGQLEVLKIADIILKPNYYDLINSNPLTELTLRKLDLELIDPKPSITSLTIHNTLLNYDLLIEKMPNLEVLRLVNCSKINSFSFLTPLTKLRNLTLNGITHLSVFPRLETDRLTELHILACKNFESFEDLHALRHLNKLSTTSTNLPPQDVEKICDTLPLSHFYYCANKKKLNDEACRIIDKFGLKNCM